MQCTKCKINADDYGIKLVQSTPTDLLCPKCIRQSSIGVHYVDWKPLPTRIKEHAEVLRHVASSLDQFAVKVEAMDEGAQNQIAPMFFAYLEKATYTPLRCL